METLTLNQTKLDFNAAKDRLKNVVVKTPLQKNANLSKKYDCNVFLKREDLQIVRSYKLRGAYNMISSLNPKQLENDLVCASAGNHAQGFAYSCNQLKVKGKIFMPVITPKQKISQTKMFGEAYIDIILVGDNFDECSKIAQAYTLENGATFIPPFDHIKIIEGQGTIGIEILEELPNIDFVFLPVGGGGLCAGLGTYVKTHSPKTTVIACEPEGAPSMKQALLAGEPVTLPELDKFVDGAAVKRVGTVSFEFCKDVIDDMHLVPEGKVCSTILKLYNEEAIVTEPAGALSIAALDQYADVIKGKNVVCIVSGGNNDIERMQEIKERSLNYEGLKHYFLINFPQRPGALKEFVNNVLGPNDDITYFQFSKKNSKEIGPAVVGIELKNKIDLQSINEKLNQCNFKFQYLNEQADLFTHLIA
jgi:threonine dehydratase